MELTAKQQAVEAIKKANNILLVSSAHPDGDSLGAVCALKLFLEKQGKKVLVACSDPVPPSLAFLPKSSEIVNEINSGRDFIISLDVSEIPAKEIKYQVEDKKLKLIITPAFGKFRQEQVSFAEGGFHFDLAIVVDTPDTDLLGPLYENNVDLFYETPVLSIDHHATNEYFGEINLIDLTASSTCEIIVSLIESLDNKFLDEEIATCLLTGIITDTGSFRNSNTSPKSLTIAAQLVAAGGRQQEIIKNIFKTKKLSTLRLWGEILSRLKVDRENLIAWSTVCKADYEAAGADESESAGVIDELMSSVPNVEIVILLSEKSDNSVRASIRTVKGVDAIAIASLFGGGGHAQAAAFKIEQTDLSQCENMIIETIRQWQLKRKSAVLDKQTGEEPVDKIEKEPPREEVCKEAKENSNLEMTKVSEVIDEKIEKKKYDIWLSSGKSLEGHTEKTEEKSSPVQIMEEVLNELKGKE